MNQINCPKCDKGMRRFDRRLSGDFMRYQLLCDEDGILIQSNYPIISGKLPKEVLCQYRRKEKD